MQPKTQKTQELESAFNELADKLERQAGYFSFTGQMANHLAHHQIVGMGEEAIPLILRRIEKQGGLWYRALESITGVAPITGGYNHTGSRGRVYGQCEGSERRLVAVGPGTRVSVVTQLWPTIWMSFFLTWPTPVTRLAVNPLENTIASLGLWEISSQKWDCNDPDAYWPPLLPRNDRVETVMRLFAGEVSWSATATRRNPDSKKSPFTPLSASLLTWLGSLRMAVGPASWNTGRS